MDDIAIMGHKSDTASVLYEILDGSPVEARRLARASDWFAQLDTPIDRRSFMAYVQVLQREVPGDSPLAELVPRWRDRWQQNACFSDSDADAFLQDYLACGNPNLLFRSPVT